jgi:hypothetical protein
MRAELVLLGRRVDMGQQLRRRLLVALLYATLAVLITVLWIFTHWRGTGAYVFWAALLACRFFLGGHYASGLVKPFNGKPPRDQAMPSSLLALKLHMYQPALAADESTYRNDERELHQRDRAHYSAYQAIGVVIAIQAFLAALRLVSPRIQSWVPMSGDELCYGFALIALTLFITLPQVILLWTEPDMEPEG